jgi:3,4-dihydroxy 2-butanone 4-phosphate synthase/GTP cyclohydrolase II
MSSQKQLFFEQEVTKKEFKDHLGHIHTAIIFNQIEPMTHVKFHTVVPDIELFLNDTRLHSMLKTINFLKSKGGVLIFLTQSSNEAQIQKDYGIGAQILNILDIKKIKLLTSGGKHSFVGLNGFGLEIIEEIQIEG